MAPQGLKPDRAGGSPAGYSGTPLVKKLGVSSTTCLVVIDAPEVYDALMAPLPAGVERQPSVTATTSLVHVFVRERDVLASHLRALRAALDPSAVVWVSWPKKASKLPTTVTEDVIREIALPLGFVDVKVCAVNEVWSGLKLVVRKALRAASPRG